LNFFKTQSLFFALFLTISGLTVGCAASLPKVDLRVGKEIFHVELATTTAEREKGLMFRRKMDENAGMLFVFAHELPRVFWMKNTYLPLSIAFANSDGVIKKILDMTPFSLAPRSSEYSVKYALEVNQGAFARAGIHVGDKIDVKSLPPLEPEALR
jgi:uncharacterized membrane protein (UPF0127 family)